MPRPRTAVFLILATLVWGAFVFRLYDGPPPGLAWKIFLLPAGGAAAAGFLNKNFLWWLPGRNGLRT
jgi:hypothetical protein